MGELLGRILAWVLAGAVARVAVGAGMAFLTYTTVASYVGEYLNGLSSAMQGMAPEAYSIVVMAGVGEAMSIVGSTLLTIAAMYAGGRMVGIRMGG